MANIVITWNANIADSPAVFDEEGNEISPARARGKDLLIHINGETRILTPGSGISLDPNTPFTVEVDNG